MEAELRFGIVTGLFYRCAGRPAPRQLDLLNEWFGGLVICREESDGNTKTPPYFSEEDLRIHAVRYHERLYSGADEIIAQLCGRLTGLARGNREKQRKNAVLVQKHVCRRMCEDYSLFEYVIALAGSAVLELADEELNTFYQELLRFVIDLAYAREEMSESERDGEPFPVDDEIFDAVVYNAAYQLNLETAEGLVNGYTWLLLGSFLRNEAGRITRRFDSSFNEVNRMPSEEPTLLSKLDYLFFPEDYEFTYDGDDFESRFPDIRWQCDQCGAVLNDQEGFDDHYEAWQCRRCGQINPLDPQRIYENNEDAFNGRMPMAEDKMKEALERRKKQQNHKR